MVLKLAPNAAPAAAHTETTLAWERHLRAALEAISPGTGDARALVVGVAGSGKSRMLRHLQRVLRDARRDVSLLGDADDDASAVPASHVLLVDDLHRLTSSQVHRLRTRIEDPRAALIAAGRPWPMSPAVTSLARELERTRPAIVLGHVTRADVLTLLAGRDERIADGCLDHILTRTGGVSWLVSAALAAHDERDCSGDPGHRELERILTELIAHRLDLLDPGLRRTVELLCLPMPQPDPAPGAAEDRDDLLLRAHAEGLTSRSGHPVPIVRSSVRATIPAHRVLDLASGLDPAGGAMASDEDLEWLGACADPRAASVLVGHADALLGSRPERAAELYRAAVEIGVPAASVSARRAQAAWAANDLDTAAILAEQAAALAPDDLVADTAAATWAAKGMMSHAAAVYRALPPRSGPTRTRALIAAVGAGERPDGEHVPADAASSLPSALGVGMDRLRDGLIASLAPRTPDTVLLDLVRAAELCTASRTSAPTPELAAVIAAIAALSLGDLGSARAIVDDAIAGGHGGPSARTRLLLWRAWVAVQSARPAEARDALARALDASTARSPRDELLARTVRIAIARRYEDAAGLAAAWAAVRRWLTRVDVDLYSILPLTELVCSAAKVGESDRVDGALAHALSLVERLDSPPLWSAHLHWAGIQRGILLSRPDDLKPHARALVAAAPHSRIAATMARAGRVWTSVLAASVDADAVEAAARGLSSIGLAWDGARLAGHGAGRTDDRRVAARLLACARELHPADNGRRAATDGSGSGDGASSAPSPEVLSEREREVATLVLQGKTYAEIGESIFISPRTAEHHIAHIRRRLGATSRSDLIAKLRVLVGESDRAETPLSGQ